MRFLINVLRKWQFFIELNAFQNFYMWDVIITLVMIIKFAE